MKAGAFTPATRAVGPVPRGPVLTLNEGGGFHPRNPLTRPGSPTRLRGAQ